MFGLSASRVNLVNSINHGLVEICGDFFPPKKTIFSMSAVATKYQLFVAGTF